MQVKPEHLLFCRVRAIALMAAILPLRLFAQEPASHQQVLQIVDQHAAHFAGTARTIWEFAQLGYHDDKSSALLRRELQAAGFRVQSPVADEPTAFVATYGQGEPVVGILGEFDALPGLSQAAAPDRSPVVVDAPGHGCGHNLLGSGAALAAVALKEYMERNHVAGTLRYYGPPAEEGGRFATPTWSCTGIRPARTPSGTVARLLSIAPGFCSMARLLMRRSLRSVAAPLWMP